MDFTFFYMKIRKTYIYRHLEELKMAFLTLILFFYEDAEDLRIQTFGKVSKMTVLTFILSHVNHSCSSVFKSLF